jgi:hypothetical protein
MGGEVEVRKWIKVMVLAWFFSTGHDTQWKEGVTIGPFISNEQCDQGRLLIKLQGWRIITDCWEKPWRNIPLPKEWDKIPFQK